MLREWQEACIFQELLKLCYGLEDRLADAEPEEVQLIGDLVRSSAVNCCSSFIITIQIQKGINTSHADDMKGMKGVILEWITLSVANSFPSSTESTNLTEGSNMRLQGPCYVLLALTGAMPSE
jgi:hypothetical protein